MFFNIAVAFTALGCHSAENRATSDKTAGTSGTIFRVGLLTPGPVTDQAWNSGAYRGLLLIRDSLKAEISHIQTQTPADFEENFRQYGAQHYALVFGHGFEFQDAALRVGPSYPKTFYVVTSGTKSSGNVASIEFAFEEGAYLAGMAAGYATKTNVIGVIGGTQIPPVEHGFHAFEAGARSVNPKVKILTSYIGNWDDVGAGKEQALAQITQHADVLFQNADAAGLGVIQAAKESQGVYLIGSNSNQNALAPALTLGSVVIDLPRAFISIAMEVERGAFTGHVVTFGVADDVVRWEANAPLVSALPERARQGIDSVQRGLHARTFSLPR